MTLGTLNFTPVIDDSALMAEVVQADIRGLGLVGVMVTEIDPSLADTATFCEHYGIGVGVSANCVVVEAKRADRVWYAACVILATTKADVNGVARRHLDARKISFALMETATKLTSMEYGGITPLGLPGDWPILVDRAVVETSHVIIGSGLRESKLIVPGALLGTLPNAVILNLTKTGSGAW